MEGAYEIIIKKEFQSDYDGQYIEIDNLVEAKAAMVQLMDVLFGYGEGIKISIAKSKEIETP